MRIMNEEDAANVLFWLVTMMLLLMMLMMKKTGDAFRMLECSRSSRERCRTGCRSSSVSYCFS